MFRALGGRSSMVFIGSLQNARRSVSVRLCHCVEQTCDLVDSTHDRPPVAVRELAVPVRREQPGSAPQSRDVHPRRPRPAACGLHAGGTDRRRHRGHSPRRRALGGDQRKREGAVLRWPRVSAHHSARCPSATRSRDARDRCLGRALGRAGGVARAVLARTRTVQASGCTNDRRHPSRPHDEDGPGRVGRTVTARAHAGAARLQGRHRHDVPRVQAVDGALRCDAANTPRGSSCAQRRWMLDSPTPRISPARFATPSGRRRRWRPQTVDSVRGERRTLRRRIVYVTCWSGYKRPFIARMLCDASHSAMRAMTSIVRLL